MIVNKTGWALRVRNSGYLPTDYSCTTYIDYELGGLGYSRPVVYVWVSETLKIQPCDVQFVGFQECLLEFIYIVSPAVAWAVVTLPSPYLRGGISLLIP